jgi:septal ring factor EnvC (AmiA/AmiB activator)
MLAIIPRWLMVAALVAAGAFAGVQTVRVATAQADADQAREQVASLREAIAQANTEAAQRTAALQSQVTKAQNEAKKRETELRAAAAGAAAESDGLRGDIARYRDTLASATDAARTERVAAVATVLGHCADRYQVLSERADRHVNDLRTMIDAWPK